MATSGRELRSARGEAARPTRKHAPGRVVLVLTLLLILAGCRPIPDPSAVATPSTAEEQPPEEQEEEEQPTAEEPVAQVSRAERLLQEGAPELLWTYQPEQPELDRPYDFPLKLARALIGETVYVGAANGYIHALDASSGERLWSYQTLGNVRVPPVQVGDSIFVASKDGYLYALDAASGGLLWRHKTVFAVAGLVAKDGIVYLDDWNYYSVAALDPASGKEIWHFEIETANLLLRTVAEGTVFAGLSGHLYALDAVSGELLWLFPPADHYFGLEVDEGLVYYTGTTTNVYALDASSGKWLWHVKTENPMFFMQPVVAGGVVYLASHETAFGAGDSLIYALEGETGEELWRYEAGTYNNYRPVVVDSIFYGGSRDGHHYALDARTGEELWRFHKEPKTEYVLRAFVDISAPTVVDGIAYFGTNSDYVFGVDSRTGEELWRYQPESGRIRLLLEDEGIIYVFFLDGDVIALLPRIERESE